MVVAFPCKIGAPVTGITLSTRVGRLSETHSDIGFQLHSVPKLRRKVRERKGGRVRGKVLFNIVHQCTLVNYDYCNLDLD